MQHDTLSDALSAINNAARDNNDHAIVSPTSNLIKNVLLKLKKKDTLEFSSLSKTVKEASQGRS